MQTVCSPWRNGRQSDDVRALAALDAFGPDHLDRLLSDVRYAQNASRRCFDEGDIATPVAYELATSVLSLIFENCATRKSGTGLDVPDLPDLAWLQENAPLQRERWSVVYRGGAPVWPYRQRSHGAS